MYENQYMKMNERNKGCYIRYEVDSDECQLSVGDRVGPETLLGLHHATGAPVRAGMNGHIATIYFDPMNDSLLVMAVGEAGLLAV
jgi:hypothetical protein